MKIINNNPSLEAAIGKICSTSKPISFQVENCLYLLPSIKEEMAEKVKELIGNQMEIAKMTGDFLGSYTCIHLQKNLYIADKDIQEAIEMEGCNAILPLSFPGSDEGKYLLVKLEEEDLQQQVSGIIYSSERHIRQEAQKTLHKHLIDNPEEFKKCVGSVCDELGEIISPHIIDDAGDHIATKPQNILIPYKLL